MAQDANKAAATFMTQTADVHDGSHLRRDMGRVLVLGWVALLMGDGGALPPAAAWEAPRGAGP